MHSGSWEEAPTPRPARLMRAPVLFSIWRKNAPCSAHAGTTRGEREIVTETREDTAVKHTQGPSAPPWHGSPLPPVPSRARDE